MAKIEKLKSGNYTVRVVVGHDADGKPIRKRFTSYSKPQLHLMIAKFEESHRNRIRRQTVAEAMDAFLTAKNAVLSPSTIRAYKSMADGIKSNYAPLCASYVDAVTAQDMQMVVNDMIESGKSPKTVHNHSGFLSAVWKYAGVSMPLVSLPQKEKPMIQIPDEETVKEILKAAEGTRLEIPLALATMGLRRSEICALTLEDLKGNVLHIHRAAVHGEGGKMYLKTTKTYTSDRFVTIPEGLADRIRKQGYITQYTPTALSHYYEYFMRKNGFQHYRLHDFRHFFVSYCHNILGLSDAQIQAITGHKTSETIRRVYLHSLEQEKVNAEVAKNIGSLIG